MIALPTLADYVMETTHTTIGLRVMRGQALVLDPSNWAKIVDLADQTGVSCATTHTIGLAITMLENTNIAELHMLLRRIPEGLINPDPRHYARE